MPRWAQDEDGGGDTGLVVRLQMGPFINCNHLKGNYKSNFITTNLWSYSIELVIIKNIIRIKSIYKSSLQFETFEMNHRKGKT